MQQTHAQPAPRISYWLAPRGCPVAFTAGGVGSEVLYVAVAPETLQPTVLVVSSHILHEDALNLIAHLVQGLDSRVFAVLGIEEESAFGKRDGFGAFTLLDGKERLTELWLEV